MRLGLLAVLFLGPAWEEVSRDVDRSLAAAWEKRKLTPSERSTDAEFARRLHLDLLGRVPTSAEITTFLANPDRKKLLESLIESPEFAKAWAQLWLIRLVGRDAQHRGNSPMRAPLEKWLEKAFASNMRYDALVRALLTAEGATTNPEEAAVAYVASYVSKVSTDTAPNLAGHVAKTFLGTRIQCAQCHDHPYEKISQKDFWGFAAYFARMTLRPIKKDKQRLEGLEIRESGRGEVRMPDSERPVAPRFLDGTTGSGANRREQVAALVTSSKSFPRAMVNWTWHHFFGAGFVNPVDDFHSLNKPSIPEALDLLARDFAENGYDLRRLIRIIVGTRAYQLSSRSSKDNERDRAIFSKSLVRPLSPEVLIRSLTTVVGAAERPGRRRDEDTLKDFIFLFDNDEKTEALNFEATVSMALFLMNGTLASRLTSAVREIAASHRSSDARVKAIFLRVLSREPSESEKRACLDFGRTEAGCADLFWTLLNSTEFFFNH